MDMINPVEIHQSIGLGLGYHLRYTSPIEAVSIANEPRGYYQVVFDACAEVGITPIEFHSLWLWTQAPIKHTFTVGVARPSDFDEPVAAVKLLDRAHVLVPAVEKILNTRMVDILGEDWVSTWWHDLPGVYDTPTGDFPFAVHRQPKI